MKTSATVLETPFRAYARLLLQLHDLIATGQGDAPEADAVRDEMDIPWEDMTPAEQERAGGLSEDLYALAETTPRTVQMLPEERQKWGQEFASAFGAKDWDRALDLLRHPPQDVPRDHVAYLQADCWEGLGVPEVALRFLRSATPLNTERAVSVLTLWFPREVG
jgi:hypothetical protein